MDSNGTGRASRACRTREAVGTGRTDSSDWPCRTGRAHSSRTLRTNVTLRTSGTVEARGTSGTLRSARSVDTGKALRACCASGSSRASGTRGTLRAARTSQSRVTLDTRKASRTGRTRWTRRSNTA